MFWHAENMGRQEKHEGKKTVKVINAMLVYIDVAFVPYT